jgi:ceramide glucosyltransferase
MSTMIGFAMASYLINILVYLSLILGAVGVAFTTAEVVLAAAFVWARRGRPLERAIKVDVQRSSSDLSARRPRVSIIKPVSGVEDGLEMNLLSFAHLTGPSYELIVSVADPDDPAIPIINKVLPLFAQGVVRVVVGGAGKMDNPKVERLVAAARYARGEILLISDSNVRVSSDYLARTLSEFEDTRVGCAVNLFVGDGAATLGALLECLYLLTFVVPGTILAASAGVTCVVGKSMAITRRVLDEIGGFESFARVLAEDQAIGLAVAGAGYQVALSPVVVRNVIESRTVAGAIKRQARWGKIRYSFSKLRYTSELVCNPLPLLLAAGVAAIAADTSSALPAALLVGSVAAARILQGAAMIHLTGANLPMASVLLVPFQDCIQAACQLIPYFSHEIDWRGFRTRLGRGTQILAPRPVVKPGA